MNCTLKLAPDSAAPPTAESRTWERHPCEVPTACRSLAGWQDRDFSWSGELRDISQGGLGLVLNRRFEPGTVIVVELDLPPGRESLLGRVVHARALDDQRWLLGCALARRLSPEKLQALVAASRGQQAGAAAEEAPALDWLSAQGGGSLGGDKRRQRFFLLRDAILEGGGPGGRSARVVVRRLHLSDCWPLEEGATILVRLRGGKAAAAGARLRVRSCSQRGDGWVIGYEFAEAPPAEFLRLLGHAAP